MHSSQTPTIVWWGLKAEEDGLVEAGKGGKVGTFIIMSSIKNISFSPFLTDLNCAYCFLQCLTGHSEGTSPLPLFWDGSRFSRTFFWLSVLDAETVCMGPGLHFGNPARHLPSPTSVPGVPEADLWNLKRDGK